jgi:zinc protease
MAGLLAGAQAPKPSPSSTKPLAEAPPLDQRGPRPPAIPSHKDLKFPPLRPVKIPDIESFTLSNGVRVRLLENRELPLVSGFVLVRTGNLFDPPDKVGVAQITGSVMRSGGTKAKTGDQIDEELENVAASVESSIGETSGTVSFSMLKENTDQTLAIFREILTAPEFRQDKIDLAKTQLRGSIARRNDDAHGIVGREFSDILYGRDNPYGWRIEYEHLDRIQREDLVAFHKRYFFPANVILAIQGDFSVPEMKQRLETLIGSWKNDQPPVPAFPKVMAKPVPGVYLAVKPDVTQTFLSVGHLGGILRDKDYPALAVMSDILGGGFSSRLFKKIRTELGFAYSIGSNWGVNYNHPGLFSISGSTKSASTVETLKAARGELDRIRTGLVTDEELDSARQTVLNSFVFNFDRPSKTLNRLVTYEYHGYPKDFIFQYQKAVEAVTKQDIQRVAQQHLLPENLTFVAVGNPKDFGTPLDALGLPVKTIDLTIPEPKRESRKSDVASLDRGAKLLERVRESLGGAEMLKSVKDFTVSAAANVNMGGGAMNAKQTNRWLAPSHFRQEQELPFGKVVVYSDGKTGWMVTPQGTQPLPAAVIKQVQGELFRLPFRLAFGRANYVGEGMLEITGDQGESVTLHVDEKTGRPVKQVYQSMGMGGTPTSVEATFSDWREVDGIQVPFKTSIEQGGKKFAEVTVTDVRINSGLKPEDLQQKP